MRLQIATAFIAVFIAMSTAVVSAQEDGLGPVLTPVPGEGETMTIDAEFALPPGVVVEVQRFDDTTGAPATCASGLTEAIGDDLERSRITLELPAECGDESSIPLLRIMLDGEVANAFFPFQPGATLNLGLVEVTGFFEAHPPSVGGADAPVAEDTQEITLPDTGTGLADDDGAAHPYALYALVALAAGAAALAARRFVRT
jgi:hypothetical protein